MTLREWVQSVPAWKLVGGIVLPWLAFDWFLDSKLERTRRK